jgi:hypothetical protein
MSLIRRIRKKIRKTMRKYFGESKKARRKQKKRRRASKVRRDQAYWSSLKNKHEGSAGWVIGNGPSLKYADLDRLKGEVCIASNKIYLAFEETEWRPDYVTVVDKVLWPKIREESLKRYSRIHLPRKYYSDDSCKSKQLIFWRKRQMPRTKPDDSCCMCSDDAIFGFHGGSTVTYENVQLAMHLGLNPIYLIGCDHHYRGESNVVQGEPVVSNEVNHFHPEYRTAGELVNPATIDLMTNSYEHARFFAEKNGYKIYNATRGGQLEVFERKDFDSILNG